MYEVLDEDTIKFEFRSHFVCGKTRVRLEK